MDNKGNYKTIKLLKAKTFFVRNILIQQVLK